MKQIVAGIEFGYINPTVITIIEIKDGNYTVIEEFYQTGLGVSDIIKKCVELKEKYNIKTFYADSTQPSYIREMNNNGIHTIASDTNEYYFIDGMNIFLKHLQGNNLKINKECKELLSELDQYKLDGTMSHGIKSLIYTLEIKG
jgi:phage terminase large subunit